jgi:hypothetical protein
MQHIELASEFGGEMRVDATDATGFEKAPKAFVPERSYHQVM